MKLNNKKILIVGLGIAGMSTAIRLKKHGFTPIIIERAEERRRGGYFIGLFRKGIDAAKELGVLDDIRLSTPEEIYSIEVDENGNKSRGVGFLEQPGYPQATLRGDIEEGLWKHIDNQVEVRFATVPLEITSDDEKAAVKLQNTITGEIYEESFGLVVGADGVRSKVRNLVFGPDDKFIKPLHTMVVAFQMSQQAPQLQRDESAVLAETNRSIWIFGLKKIPPTVLFTFRTPKENELIKKNKKEVIEQVYKNFERGGITNHVISELEKAPNALFDTVNIVKMNRWSKGRVVLVGDSAWCLTFFSGMGATTAMMGAIELADQIAKHENKLEKALRNYRFSLLPFIEIHRLYTLFKAQVFVPSNNFFAYLRKKLIAKGAKKMEKKHSSKLSLA